MNYKERVGLNINYYRKLSDLTLKQVADKVGITEATMQKYEKGLIKRVDIEMLESIANAINTTVDRLTGWLSKEEEQKAHEERVAQKHKKWEDIYNSLTDDGQKAVNEIMMAIKTKKISPDSITRAMEFLADYQKASPAVQTAINALLGDSQ